MSLKALVAQDDAATVQMMQEVLAGQGVSSLRVVKDLPQASRVINSERVDAVFSDLMMPNMDGIEFVRRIRASKWNPRVPVVILAKQGGTEARAQAFAAGANLFLQKPVDKPVLSRLIKSTRGFFVAEKLRYARIPFSNVVRFRFKSHEIAGTAINLSRDAILFQGDGTVARRCVVALTFRLDPNSSPVQIVGVVVRADPSKRIVVRFAPSLSEDMLRIREFVAKEADVY